MAIFIVNILKIVSIKYLISYMLLLCTIIFVVMWLSRMEKSEWEP